MIVDFHYHLIPAVNELVVENMIKYIASAAKAMGKSISLDEMKKQGLETWADPTGERLIKDMDAAGIDVTVICNVDNMDNPALTVERVQRANRTVGGVAQRFPDRVVALAGVDPRRAEAVEITRQCFEEFGVRGVKYHPDYGYDPSGPESYKVLDIVAHNNGLLLTHTGPLMPPARCKYAEPILLADLAVDFPTLNVVAAHMGAINWRPWAALAAYQPTLFGDLAMWDLIAFRNYDFFCRELRNLLDFAGASKVLFGTDGPFFSIIETAASFIALIEDLPDNAPDGIEFTTDEVDAILGGNAAALLNLA